MTKKKTGDQAGVVKGRPKRGAAAAAQKVLPSITTSVLVDSNLVASSRTRSSQALDESFAAVREPLCPSQPNLPPSTCSNAPEHVSKTIVTISSEYQARLLKVQKICDDIDAQVELKSAHIRALGLAQFLSSKAQVDLQSSKFSLDVQNMPLEEFLKSYPGIKSMTTDDGKVLLQKSASSYPKLEDSKINLDDMLMKVKDGTAKRLNSAFFTPYSRSKISESQIHGCENDEQELEEQMEKPVGEELSWPEYYMRLQNLGYKPGHTPALGSHRKFNTPMSFTRGVTPKTLRPPKFGETMLSINGSPLGQYGKTPGSADCMMTTRTQTRLTSSKRSLRDL